MTLPPLDVETLARNLSDYSSHTKSAAKETLRKFVNAATLLDEKFEALHQAAAEIARENVGLRLESEALRGQIGSGIVSLSDLSSFEFRLLDQIRQIFSEQSEPAYQPVVNPPAWTAQQVVADCIDIHPVVSARENGYEAVCGFYTPEGQCEWRTTGSESNVDDAAWEHAETHATKGD